MIRVADYIVNFLNEEAGVDDIFLVTGGGSIFLSDAIVDSNVKGHFCHNEQAVSIAAEGYARTKGGIGVGMVTTGPGCTNAITGVGGAWTDCVPLFMISGQVFQTQTIGDSGLRQFGVQEVNIIPVVKPLTKYAEMVKDKNKIRYHLQKALHIAKSGRPGPVWLDIPADIQLAKVDPKDLIDFDPAELPQENYPEFALDKHIDELVDKLISATRPVIHVGHGVKLAGAEEEFFNFVEEAGIPFLTSRNATDICDNSHPLYIGRPGTFSQRAGNFSVQNSDFYLAIGVRLALTQTGYNSKDYARNAFKVMVDVDIPELSKQNLDLDQRIYCDAKEFINVLREKIKGKNLKQDAWLEKINEWKAKYPVLTQDFIEHKGSVNSYFFAHELSEVLTPKDVIVTDMGFSFQSTHQVFNVKKGQKFFSNGGFAAMGWGLPAAIGAAVATKGRSICVTGDGGFMMNMQEMATVIQENLPIKIFLLNNNGYLTIKQTQELGFNSRFIGSDLESGLYFPNFEKLAASFDMTYRKLDSHDGLREKVDEMLKLDGPLFCEIIMDPDQILGPRCINKTLPDGSKKQTPLEEMYPFLDDEEQESNMIVTNMQKKP